LIFGNRSCTDLTATSSEHKFDICNLVYRGEGKLFDAIRKSFDPAKVTHPIWDESILANAMDESTWTSGFSVSPEAINPTNTELFDLRKRQFYFFNSEGQALLDISDDAVMKFQRFLESEDKAIVKDLIAKLNSFFGTASTNSELEIWASHRYNNAPRKVLFSTGKMKRSDFCVGRPKLISTMEAGIRMVQNYIRLEKKKNPDVFLKIDFSMYSLLLEAERGVPVLLMESDIVKKIWRFVEQLQDTSDLDEDDDVTISLLDIPALV